MQVPPCGIKTVLPYSFVKTEYQASRTAGPKVRQPASLTKLPQMALVDYGSDQVSGQNCAVVDYSKQLLLSLEPSFNLQGNPRTIALRTRKTAIPTRPTATGRPEPFAHGAKH